MQGNAGAGGVFLALAADRVYARDGVILNPHYKGMGNLYGSEYWTYLLPRRVAPEQRAGGHAEPPAARRAASGGGSGSSTAISGRRPAAFRAEVAARAQRSRPTPHSTPCSRKRSALRQADEAVKPLAAYRAEELERMKLNFFGFDPSYHVARYHFVYKVPRSRTPSFLARHRATRRGATARPFPAAAD